MKNPFVSDLKIPGMSQEEVFNELNRDDEANIILDSIEMFDKIEK